MTSRGELEHPRLPGVSPGDKVLVTRPTMPGLAEYAGLLEGIWARKWLTNNGAVHEALAARVRAYLDLPHVSLLCNGTAALLIALRLFDLRDGEVVTTPFTFPATPHAITWSGLTPVFADVDAATGNLDPEAVRGAVTPRTRAILAVHVYGIPCDVDGLAAVAREHGLPLLYDAAHTFGARYRGEALAAFGDAAALSFHATKLFSTAEGGALAVRSADREARVNLLKNFGIVDEETVAEPGINGKMSELHAAFGLLQLDGLSAEINARRAIDTVYPERLADVPGIRFPRRPDGYEPNHAYCPVFIDETRFGMDRDDLCRRLRAKGIHARKYFHPLCSQYPCYAAANPPGKLPRAELLARRALCLPIYGGLDPAMAGNVAAILRER